MEEQLWLNMKLLFEKNYEYDKWSNGILAFKASKRTKLFFISYLLYDHHTVFKIEKQKLSGHWREQPGNPSCPHEKRPLLLFKFISFRHH